MPLTFKCGRLQRKFVVKLRLLCRGLTINTDHTRNLPYAPDDFPDFDEGRRSIVSLNNNEKKRQSPKKQMKYSANCALPFVSRMPVLLINAIVEKTLAPVARASNRHYFLKFFM
jgi:hypothetical protein